MLSRRQGRHTVCPFSACVKATHEKKKHFLGGKEAVEVEDKSLHFISGVKSECSTLLPAPIRLT